MALDSIVYMFEFILSYKVGSTSVGLTVLSFYLILVIYGYIN